MKKFTATLLASSLMAVAAFGQGQVLFQNVNSVGLQAYMYASDGTTKLAGTGFQAALINSDTSAILAQTGFLSGGGAGIFSGGTVTVPGVAGGSIAHLQVEVWNTAFGSTYASASASGQANAFAISPVLNITVTSAPNPPANLTGLTPLSLNTVVPEPSSLALAGLGAAALMVFRRRK